MDFIVQLPATQRTNYDSLFVVVDKLSKMAHFIPVKMTYTAGQVARAFMDNIVCLHSVPRQIISDRDAKFTSNFWKSLFEILQTKLKFSTANHPQTDGQTERMNRSIEEMLRACVNEGPHQWDKYIKLCEFAYNNSKNASTKYTPFFLNYAQHPYTPLSLLRKPNIRGRDKTAIEFVLGVHDIMNSAKQHLKTAQENQQKYANKNKVDRKFEIGDKVLIDTTAIGRRLAMDTFDDKYAGPFEVIGIPSPNAYKLKLPPDAQLHNVFNVSKLILYKDRKQNAKEVGTVPEDEDLQIEVEISDSEEEVEDQHELNIKEPTPLPPRPIHRKIIPETDKHQPVEILQHEVGTSRSGEKKYKFETKFTHTNITRWVNTKAFHNYPDVLNKYLNDHNLTLTE